VLYYIWPVVIHRSNIIHNGNNRLPSCMLAARPRLPIDKQNQIHGRAPIWMRLNTCCGAEVKS